MKKKKVMTGCGPSTREAEADLFPSSRTAMATQRSLVSKIQKTKLPKKNKMKTNKKTPDLKRSLRNSIADPTLARLM